MLVARIRPQNPPVSGPFIYRSRHWYQTTAATVRVGQIFNSTSFFTRKHIEFIKIMALDENQARAEKEIFDKIANNDVTGLKNILLHTKVEADLVDENGMTPLQHACYKGNKEIVQMFVDQGANVNVGKHKHKYSSLHFAALSGNAEICQMLLAAGAKTHVTNSVGRTAAQMASFVGNHACVAIINNFLPRSEVDYYTLPHGFETEPKLPPHLAAPLHKFIMQINLNPVRIAMNLQGVLLDHLSTIITVLELMRERESKRGHDTSEVASFKFHYLEYIIKEISRLQKKQQEQLQRLQEETKPESGNVVPKDNDKDKEDRKWDPVEMFAKNMLRHPQSNAMDYQERFLRECIREYPDRDSILFRQMVASLAPSESPSALYVITSAINGTRAFNDGVSAACATCGEERAPKKCSKCRQVQYCDRECQRLHWFIHKKECARLGATSNSNGPQDAPDVINQLTELKNSNRRPAASDDASVLLYMAQKSESLGLRKSSVAHVIAPLGNPHSLQSRDGLRASAPPRRQLTSSELSNPALLFTSRTPEPSILEAPSVLQTEILSRPNPSTASSLLVEDPIISKKLGLNNRYPLLPVGKMAVPRGTGTSFAGIPKPIRIAENTRYYRKINDVS